MELTDELLVQMRAYLAGQLNESDRQAFEARIRQDADLQRELVVQHELRQGLSLLAQKERFKAMHTDLLQRGLLTPATTEAELADVTEPVGNVRPFPTSRRPFWQRQTYLTAAAALVLILGISWFFFWKQTLPSPTALQRDNAFYTAFTTDLKPAPSPPADPDRLGASPMYPAGQQDSMEVQRGVRLLQNQQTQLAIRQLQPVAQGLPGHWRASAQWYLALAYLKNGQTPQTDSLLTLITSANGHPYQLEARRLSSQFPHTSPSRP